MNFKEITPKERVNCQRVVLAFEELYDLYGDMLVADAGRFGFVHLKWFDGESFSSCNVYTDSFELFGDLWEAWREYQLLEPVKGTQLADLSYEELYELLKTEEKIALENKRVEFWKLSFGE